MKDILACNWYQENFLVGLEASNFSFEGHPKQIAYFDASNSNIGLSGGIVLSTGDVSVLAPFFLRNTSFCQQNIW